MPLTFVTETGSLYELDPVNRRVRRISGDQPPTPRQGSDGEWRTFVSWLRVVHHPDGAVGLWFDWTGQGNGTWTSPIVSPDPTTIIAALEGPSDSS